MQMTPDQYADYIADGSKYSKHGVRWQFLRDRAMKVIGEIFSTHRPDWRPIATAPRDGTEILLFTDEGEIRNGAWVNAEPDGPDYMGHDAGWQSNCGTIVPGRSFGNPDYFWEGGGHPTHWKPLPEHPRFDDDAAEAGQ